MAGVGVGAGVGDGVGAGGGVGAEVGFDVGFWVGAGVFAVDELDDADEALIEEPEELSDAEEEAEDDISEFIFENNSEMILFSCDDEPL